MSSKAAGAVPAEDAATDALNALLKLRGLSLDDKTAAGGEQHCIAVLSDWHVCALMAFKCEDEKSLPRAYTHIFTIAGGKAGSERGESEWCVRAASSHEIAKLVMAYVMADDLSAGDNDELSEAAKGEGWITVQDKSGAVFWNTHNAAYPAKTTMLEQICEAAKFECPLDGRIELKRYDSLVEFENEARNLEAELVRVQQQRQTMVG